MHPCLRPAAWVAPDQVDRSTSSGSGWMPTWAYLNGFFCFVTMMTRHARSHMCTSRPHILCICQPHACHLFKPTSDSASAYICMLQSWRRWCHRSWHSVISWLHTWRNRQSRLAVRTRCRPAIAPAHASIPTRYVSAPFWLRMVTGPETCATPFGPLPDTMMLAASELPLTSGHRCGGASCCSEHATAKMLDFALCVLHIVCRPYAGRDAQRPYSAGDCMGML